MDLAAESRCLRWLAVTQCPSIYQNVKDGTNGYSKSSWPEATVFAYWWQAAKDMCLSCVLDLVVDLDAARKHVSLHFDGVLLSAELVEAVEIQHENKAFVAIAEAEILRRTGFCVIIHEKKFQSLRQIFLNRKVNLCVYQLSTQTNWRCCWALGTA